MENESYALTEDDTLWYWGHDNNGKPYCLDTPVIVPEAVGKTTPQKIKKLFYTTESDMYACTALAQITRSTSSSRVIRHPQAKKLNLKKSGWKRSQAMSVNSLSVVGNWPLKKQMAPSG